MSNEIVQRFRKQLHVLGCSDVRIRRHTGPSGRIQFCQYHVRFTEPVGHSVVSGVYSLVDMQRALDAAPAPKK